MWRRKIGDAIVELPNDPNPFPDPGVVPAYCTSLIAGTGQRRILSDFSYYDDEATKNVFKFFTGLKHTQGRLAGEEFLLSPEQQWMIREAYGWYNADSTRKYRIIFLEMGRGNGKSQLGGGIAGYLLLADGELHPEVVGVAATRPQARKYCFERLKAMIQANPSLGALVDLYRYEIRRRESSKWGGTYEATSSDVSSAWGGAPHGVVFDEVHAQKNRDLWDAMETALGKRLQPQMWGFTTAGWDRTSICWELHERVREISQGTIEDTEFFGIIWAADEDADWTDPEVWRSANPLLESEEGSGVTISGAPPAITMAFMKAKCEKAKSTPAFQNTFRTMYLSQWVGAETAFIDMATFDMNDMSPLPPPAKRPAFGGLDLSSTTDLSAFTVVTRNANGKVEFHVQLYAPEEGIIERERRDRLPYREWVKKGWLKLTPGATIDQEAIKLDVFKAAEAWDLKDVGYDRWNASKLVRELSEEGITMVAMGQGYASLSAPSKSMLQLVADRMILTGGNDALRAQLSFTSALTDAAGNIKPDKSKSSARIDGVVSSIMALDGLNRRGSEPRKSAYEPDEEELMEDVAAEQEIAEAEVVLPSYGRRSAYEED